LASPVLPNQLDGVGADDQLPACHPSSRCEAPKLCGPSRLSPGHDPSRPQASHSLRPNSSSLNGAPIPGADGWRGKRADRTTFPSRSCCLCGLPFRISLAGRRGKCAESGLAVFRTLQERFYSQARFPIRQLLLYGLQGDSVEQDIGSQKVKGCTTVWPACDY
jgi:hypothetical protein